MNNREKRDWKKKKKEKEQICRDLWTLSKGLIYVQLESLREKRKKWCSKEYLKKKNRVKIYKYGKRDEPTDLGRRANAL